MLYTETLSGYRDLQLIWLAVLAWDCLSQKVLLNPHGGRMWATNNNNGEKTGATFSFTLPLTTEKIQSDSEQDGTSKY